MADSKKRTLTLASRFEEIKRVEPFVNGLQNWLGFSDDTYGNIILSLNEAVTNAVVHGNKEKPSKKVVVTANREDDLLKITVEDEGEGFNPNDIPDPLKDENLLNEGGRGVYLIEQFADKVTYSEGGTKITIEFEI